METKNLETIIQQQYEQIAQLTNIIHNLSQQVNSSGEIHKNGGKDMPYLKEGTIRKRKDGRWEIRYMDNGKQLSLCDRNQTKLIKQFNERIKERNKRMKSGIVIEVPNKNITLHNWVDKWYTNYKVGTINVHYAKNMRLNIEKHIKSKFPDIPLNDLNPFIIEKCLSQVTASRTRKDVCDIINQALKMAYKKQLMKTDVMSLVEKPRHERKHGKAFTAEQQAQFLTYAKQHSKYYSYFLFYFTTGCRTGEIYTVRKCDIDFNTNRVHIHGTKTKASDRTIPLFTPLLELKASLQNKQNTDFVFTITDKYIRAEFKRIVKEIGVDETKYTVYSMRHSFATRCVEMGIDIKTISVWMSHTNIVTTLKNYVHLLTDYEQTQAEVYNENSIKYSPIIGENQMPFCP